MLLQALCEEVCKHCERGTAASWAPVFCATRRLNNGFCESTFAGSSLRATHPGSRGTCQTALSKGLLAPPPCSKPWSFANSVRHRETQRALAVH